MFALNVSDTDKIWPWQTFWLKIFKSTSFIPLFLSLSLPPDAQPTEAERETWEEVDVVLKDALGILDELQAYKGAGQEIREVLARSVMFYIMNAHT